MKQYTVKQLADLAAVSVRTLHYYDKIGLLEPSFLADNGYRFYEKKELLRLQQILFLRELDFPLDEIKALLDHSDYVLIDALEEQKQLLQQRMKKTKKLTRLIDHTIEHMKDKNDMTDEELYDPFKDKDVAGYQDEVKEQWGSSEAYAHSQKRMSKMTKADVAKIKKEEKELCVRLADVMDMSVEDAEVQTLVQQHYDGVNRFYDCDLDMYRNLGQMYVDDERFTAHYDKVQPGLALFLRDAINAYCDAGSVDDDV